MILLLQNMDSFLGAVLVPDPQVMKGLSDALGIVGAKEEV
jgi:hypothetical protein